MFTARVRSTREGNVLTRVCPSINLSVHRGGGYPYPIMLCNISQNAMRQRGAWSGTPPVGGGTPVRYPPRGGYPVRYPRGVPDQVPPLGGGSGTPRGGTQVGQQKEYSLHGGRYASCIHAGGLSCLKWPSISIFSDLFHDFIPEHSCISNFCEF